MSRKATTAADTARLPDDLLTPAQVAERLRITVRTLRTWRDAGEGPPWMRFTPRGHVFYSRTDLANWIGSRRFNPNCEANQ